MFSVAHMLNRIILVPAILIIFALMISAIPTGIELVDTAQAQYNSNEIDVKREINSGLDLMGRSKTEVVELIGRPRTKDRSPSKSRYTEKWTYSCKDKNIVKKSCVFLYFGADRVKKVEMN